MIGINNHYTNKDVKTVATQAAKEALRKLLGSKGDLSPEAEEKIEILAKNLGGLLSDDQVLKNIKIKGGGLA